MRTQEAVRLLGPCPKCDAESSIFSLLTLDKECPPDDWRKAKCMICEHVWDNWFGIPLQIVMIELGERHIELKMPSSSDVPFSGFWISVLNSAMMVKFDLHQTCSTEGGVEGLAKGSPFEMSNIYHSIGLSLDRGQPDHPGVREAMEFYFKLMKRIFHDEFKYDGTHFLPGFFLQLKEKGGDKERHLRLALQIATGALATIESYEFAEQVAQSLRGSLRGGNPFATSLTGMG